MSKKTTQTNGQDHDDDAPRAARPLARIVVIQRRRCDLDLGQCALRLHGGEALHEFHGCALGIAFLEGVGGGNFRRRRRTRAS